MTLRCRLFGHDMKWDRVPTIRTPGAFKMRGICQRPGCDHRDTALTPEDVKAFLDSPFAKSMPQMEKFVQRSGHKAQP